MALFADAHGIQGLVAARALPGFATGIAMAAVGAALVDVDWTTGPLVNAVTPFAGMTIGILGSSTLVQFAPMPLHLVTACSCWFSSCTLLLLAAVPETENMLRDRLNALRGTSRRCS